MDLNTKLMKCQIQTYIQTSVTDYNHISIQIYDSYSRGINKKLMIIQNTKCYLSLKNAITSSSILKTKTNISNIYLPK